MENKQALEVLVPLLKITRGDVHEAIEAAQRLTDAGVKLWNFIN